MKRSIRHRTLVDSSTKRIIQGLSVCIFVLAVSLQTNGQQTYATFRKYGELYDTIFPRSSDDFNFGKQEFSIDIRWDPSFSAPRQVSITRFRDGTFTAFIYKLANEKESIGDQVNSLIQNGVSDDVKALSSQLKVSKTAIKNPDFLLSAIRQFFKKTSFQKETRISLDADSYNVWYVDAGNKICLSLAGGAKFEKGESPVITWVRSLFLELQRSERQKPN